MAARSEALREGCGSLLKGPEGTSCPEWSGLRNEPHKLGIETEAAVFRAAVGRRAHRRPKEMAVTKLFLPMTPRLAQPCPGLGRGPCESCCLASNRATAHERGKAGLEALKAAATAGQDSASGAQTHSSGGYRRGQPWANDARSQALSCRAAGKTRNTHTYTHTHTGRGKVSKGAARYSGSRPAPGPLLTQRP